MFVGFLRSGNRLAAMLAKEVFSHATVPKLGISITNRRVTEERRQEEENIFFPLRSGLKAPKFIYEKQKKDVCSN